MDPGMAPAAPASTHGCQRGAPAVTAKGFPKCPHYGEGGCCPLSGVPSGFFWGGGPPAAGLSPRCHPRARRVPAVTSGHGDVRDVFHCERSAGGQKYPQEGGGDTGGAQLGDTGAPAACQPHGAGCWGHWGHWERWRSSRILRHWCIGSTGGRGGAVGTGSAGMLGALGALKALGTLAYWVYWEYWGGAGVSRALGALGALE